MSDINYVNKPIMNENVQITKEKLALKQPKTLETPITVLNEQQTSVEGTLNAINNKERVLTKQEYMALTEEEKLNGTTYYINDINGDYSFADTPIGAILPFGGTDAPDDWLLCQGQAISRTDYADLFEVIGTTYGSGDGSTTFNIPNLKGKVVVGLDSNDTDFDTLGESGGEKTHQLTKDEMPSHNHTNGDTYIWVGSGGNLVDPSGGSSVKYQKLSNGNTGGNQAHNNLQPYIVTNYIIKAKITTLPLDFEQELNNILDDYVEKSDVQSSAISGNANPISSGGAYTELNGKADKATTLAGYNISNAYTKDEVDNKISELVTSMTWKPAVATYADIATTYPNPQEGWTVVTTDTNIAWRYTNGQWIEISANTIPVVTASVNGLMTSEMLAKLNGIASGAEVNVQSNWTQTNTSADDYIKNKPTTVSGYGITDAYTKTATDNAITAAINAYKASLKTWRDVTSQAATFQNIGTGSNTIRIYTNGVDCIIVGEIQPSGSGQPLNTGWISSLQYMTINSGYRPAYETFLGGFDMARYHAPIIWYLNPSGNLQGYTGDSNAYITRLPINGRWQIA